MIVCHCTGATDRDVRQAIASSGGDRTEALRVCGAGGCCGGCKAAVLELLAESERRRGSERPAARE
ncbi:MAG: (2Fe-2S)-binding protein [Planctomycetes bacterium]|nr:(2Fe-2S)-binding protein [Planctomycetota bacterium]